MSMLEFFRTCITNVLYGYVEFERFTCKGMICVYGHVVSFNLLHSDYLDTRGSLCLKLHAWLDLFCSGKLIL